MSFCQNCGGQNADSSKFCQFCGSALSPSAPSPAADQPVQPTYSEPTYNQPTYPQPDQSYNQPSYNQPAQGYGQQQNYQPYAAATQYVAPVATGGLLAWSIVTLLLCTIPGIVALVQTGKINKATTYEQQQKAMSSAKTWCIVGTVLGVLALIGSMIANANS